MPQDLIRDNQLNRKATADALRRFLEEIIRASGLELKATVHFLAPDASAGEGEAEVALIEIPVDPASGHLSIYSSKRLDV